MLIDGSIYGGVMRSAKEIANYPGFLKITGEELSESMFEQVEALNIEYKKGKVTAVINKGDIKQVMINNELYQTKNIIIAAGRTSKHLNIEGEEEFLGRGISYCALCDGNLFKNKTVALIGENDIEEEVSYLSNIVKEIIIISKADIKFNNENIKIINDSKIVRFNGKDIIESITLKNNKEYDLKIDGVFLSIGYEANLDIYKKLGLEMDNNYIIVNQDMKTNIDGIYACGDIIKKSIYQITTAVAEGTIAATSIMKN